MQEAAGCSIDPAAVFYLTSVIFASAADAQRCPVRYWAASIHSCSPHDSKGIAEINSLKRALGKINRKSERIKSPVVYAR